MGTGRQYDEEFKKQAIKLGKEVGIKAAAEELGIPKGTLGTWLKKAVTDISELKAKDGKVYVSAIFDCFDLMPLGLAIEDNMRASLCCHTIENAKKPILTPKAASYISTEEASIQVQNIGRNCKNTGLFRV